MNSNNIKNYKVIYNINIKILYFNFIFKIIKKNIKYFN